MKRRVKRTAKRKLKRSFKIFVLILVILLIVGAIIFKQLTKPAPVDLTGDINMENESPDIIEDISKVEGAESEFTYIVLSEGGAYASYGDTDILIDVYEGIGERFSITDEIEYLILTNKSVERTSGLSELKCKVDNIIVPSDLTLPTEMDSEVMVFDEDLTLGLGDGLALFIASPDNDSKDYRDHSLLTTVSYLNTSYIYMSDSGEKEEAPLRAAGIAADVVVLSNNEKGNTFLEDAVPRIMVYTKRPTERILDLAGGVYSTWYSGDIELVSTGSQVNPRFNFSELVTSGNVEEFENRIKEKEQENSAPEEATADDLAVGAGDNSESAISENADENEGVILSIDSDENGSKNNDE